MYTLAEGTQIPLSTVIANPTADADGIVMTFSPGCVYAIFKPTGGAVTVEAVIYMNRKIAPDDLTTALTEVYTYV